MGKRGVSEVVGAILIAVIVLAMSMSWAVMEAGNTNKQTTSVVDMMKTSERSLRQSLSLAYYYKQGSNLNLLFYNYGTENSTPQLVLMNQNIAYWQTTWTFKWYTVTDTSGNFGSQLGQTTYTGTGFTFNWGSGMVYGGQSTHVGYQATTTLYFTGSTSIAIQTNDGMEVYIDGQAVFGGNAWKIQSSTATYTNIVSLQSGTHQITVKWYQWEGDSYSSFSASNAAPYSSLSMINMNTQAPCNTISPQTLVKFTLPASTSSTIDLMVTTVEGGTFTWKLTV
ncbi:MAG: hypothetical protein ACQCN4_02790 [Candidatus Bathyarchaeia archaeon]|jgi:hypothetical protein